MPENTDLDRVKVTSGRVAFAEVSAKNADYLTQCKRILTELQEVNREMGDRVGFYMDIDRQGTSGFLLNALHEEKHEPYASGATETSYGVVVSEAGIFQIAGLSSGDLGRLSGMVSDERRKYLEGERGLYLSSYTFSESVLQEVIDKAVKGAVPSGPPLSADKLKDIKV